MAVTYPLSLILLSLVFSIHLSSSEIETMRQGSSLSVDNPNDVMLSPNGMFSAGFYAVGENAYSFAIWFSEPHPQTRNPTVVWMANRDQPVNGKRSTVSLLHSGNLVLNDADNSHVWSTDTVSLSSSVHLLLNDTGNLVLLEEDDGVVLWQSFDFPTDTLLPQQVLTRYAKLISSRSNTNKSSGFYTLFFDNDNILRLLYDGPEVSGLYWPDPWFNNWEANRAGYNNSRVAVMDTLGNFSSSDDFNFMTTDYGTVIQRRFTLDHDGNIRVYSRRLSGEEWSVSWQAKARPCSIHGICGPNSLCTYNHDRGLNCSCLPGYKMMNVGDWSYGCEPKFTASCNVTESRFLYISNVELYGYDYGIMENYTLKQCKDLCLQLCNCQGIQYTYVFGPNTYTCYPKLQLQNAYRTPYFNADLYLKLPANSSYSFDDVDDYSLDCSSSSRTMQLERAYEKGHGNRYLKFLIWFAGGVGGLEVLCIFLVWFFLVRTRQPYSGADQRIYNLAMNGFKKFSYSELKQATRGFSQEIGRGAAGTVYKGVLSDQRVAAVKRLKDANQGEEEFLAEVSSIGRLNHMNLIEMWGYCAEGKHRLLVYEFMEHGSLAENIKSNELDWAKRFDIALGTAKGLAYIHEECLEWILHCDVKPQNILLDSTYQPKVADFGLSKLRNRNDTKYSSFSRIRGTRGYMAPEWVFNLQITSKVDVYSYGIVVLEMITGKSATKDVDATTDDGVEKQRFSLITWLRQKQNEGSRWVNEILDPTIEGGYDEGKMEALARVALQCVEEEKDKRPTMSQVIEVLQKCSRENDNQ
ncbi:putative receptor protein kinase ZmPK1 [Abrus precatorius]|uniref:Receptor-like serine/threonine-protein kinase n=1 Tax=Abrus precatorius TaxID=3816 RepID=A0A8B8LL13_ABRPR|nr:putative receptor protein kinase ZmPK1 [Abrus precatorius]